MTNQTLENLMILIRKHPKQVSKADSYYTHAFTQIEKGKKLTWNWSAALFGFYWFIYRKMYLAGIMIMLLEAIIYNIFLEYFFWQFSTSFSLKLIILSMLGLITVVIFGFWGNAFYYKHLQKKVSQDYHLYLRPKNVDVLSVWFIILVNLGSPTSKDILYQFPHTDKSTFFLISCSSVFMMIWIVVTRPAARFLMDRRAFQQQREKAMLESISRN